MDLEEDSCDEDIIELELKCDGIYKNISNVIKDWLKNKDNYVSIDCGCGRVMNDYSHTDCDEQIYMCSHCPNMNVLFNQKKYYSLDEIDLSGVYVYDMQQNYSMYTSYSLEIYDNRIRTIKLYPRGEYTQYIFIRNNNIMLKEHLPTGAIVVTLLYIYNMSDLYHELEKCAVSRFGEIGDFYKRLPILSLLQQALDDINPNKVEDITITI